MPTPVSVTLNSTTSVPSIVHSRMSTVIVPSCVNLLALLNRLSRIWRVLVRSACIGRTSSAPRTVKRVPVLLDQRPDGVHQPADHGLDLERLEREHHLAGFDLREIEDAVDQIEQVLAGRLDPLQVANRLRLPLVFRRLLQQLAVENDGVQRRAELVAHAGEELALGARRLLGALLRDPQLVDQHRPAARHPSAACRERPRARSCSWPARARCACAR